MTEQTEQAAKSMLLSQDEAGYIIDATRRQPIGQMCKNCRFFDYPGSCHIVAAYPEPIYPDGWCEWWAKKPDMKPEPLEVVIVEESDDMDDEMKVGMMSRYDAATAPPVESIIEKRKGLQLRDHVEPCFKVLSNGLWLAFYTNNVQDRDGEILRGKAHKEAVKRVKAGLVEMPELWRSHIEGTAHGKALHVDYIEEGGVLTVYAVGEFYDTPEAKAIKRFYEKAKPGDISLSHGFMYPRWALKNGEYEVYNTFEISTLKRGQEANEWTNFSLKGKAMPLPEAQRKDIEDSFGDAAPEIIKRVEAHSKAVKSIADGLNAKYKGYTDVTDIEGDGEAQDDTTAKAFGALLPTLLEDSAEQMKLMQAMDKRLDSVELQAKNAELEKRVKALEALLDTAKNAQPASESASTVVDKNGKDIGHFDVEALAKAYAELQAKQSGEGNTALDFFGVQRQG